MSKTTYSIERDNFIINNEFTYSDLHASDSRIHGLLFNARFIQGIFNDVNPSNHGRYNRFNKCFCTEKNTEELIQALPQWYEAGLRAITVGMQGGGPIYTYEDWSCIDTHTFSRDGKVIEEAAKKRLEKIIKVCDELGMLVIVSILYQAQLHLFEDGNAIFNAVRTTCTYLKDLGYSNIIIEIANEHDIGQFDNHPLFKSGEGMSTIIYLAKEWCDNRFAVGTSCGGGIWEKEVVSASDIIMIHGNGLHREEYYRFIKEIRAFSPQKPIVCNEDSQRISHMNVCTETHTSWGYYNNFTKQEPPVNWEITPGEDEFFVDRLQETIYGKSKSQNKYYLQGFEPQMHIEGNRYIRLASRYPEKIDCVKYYEDERLLDIAYEEPFMMYSVTTWEQKPYKPLEDAKVFKAEISLHTGEVEIININLDECI